MGKPKILAIRYKTASYKILTLKNFNLLMISNKSRMLKLKLKSLISPYFGQGPCADSITLSNILKYGLDRQLHFTQRKQSSGFCRRLLGSVSDHGLINRASKKRALHQVISIPTAQFDRLQTSSLKPCLHEYVFIKNDIVFNGNSTIVKSIH